MTAVATGELVNTVEVRAIDASGQTVLDGAGRPVCGIAVLTSTDRPGEYDFTVNRNNYGVGSRDIEEYILIDVDEKRRADGSTGG